MARVRLFAAAAEIVGTHELELTVSTVGELRTYIRETYGLSADRVVTKCSVMVGGVRVESDAQPIAENDTVDVLPPFAGG